MLKCFFKIPILSLWAVCLISCSSANNKPIKIGFSRDSTDIVFTNIDPAGLLQIKNTPGIEKDFSDIINILDTPLEDDSIGREVPVAGEIEVTDSTIVFKPEKSFVQGKKYLVISYMNVQLASPAMLIKGKVNQGIKPQQVTLKR